MLEITSTIVIKFYLVGLLSFEEYRKTNIAD